MAALIPPTKGPLQNPLTNYASYNYILSLSALTKDQVNDPDGTYMSDGKTELICKSGHADPNNRINVPGFGKNDFFINSLELESSIGFRDGKNTNVFAVTFEVIEPYSVGLFLIACQLAAARCDFPNYHCAPFLLTVEFKGNKENGIMQDVPRSKKYIPIIISSVEVNASESGARYTVTANVHTSFSQTIIYSKIPKDISISGKTVQEVLQSLETSLQYSINQYKKEEAVKVDGESNQPDQILILFPTKNNLSTKVQGKSPNTNRATLNKNDKDQSSTSPFIKLGTTEQPVSNATNQIQASDINNIGTASLLFGTERKGDSSVALYNKVVKEKQMNRSSVTVDDTTGTFKFAQGTNIVQIINEVILNSDYAVKALKDEGVDSFGNRTWWRVDTQTYYLGKNREGSTNLPATLTVYRVLEYKCHTSVITSPGLKPIGIDKINENVPKVYNYIYSGTDVRGSTEIIKFNIQYNFGWLTTLLADKGNRSQDTETQDNRSASDTNKNASQKGIDTKTESPEYQLGASVGPVFAYGTIKPYNTSAGGTTADTPEIQTARMFQALISNPLEMVGLDMEIIGDPFWISSSGLGNYTAPLTDNDYVNSDYSVNWQTGEVYIHVNFRSPIDINQATGMYQFPRVSGSYDSAIMFKGIYRVNMVTSTFKDGMFKQTLKGFRVNNQFETKSAEKPNTLNTSKPDNTTPTTI